MHRVKDIFVVVFCLSGAVFSLNMFRLDLFQAIASQNNEPVGTVTIRYNNVQRRLRDRVLWSRLFAEAPVYNGDLIRVAEHSAATLHINGSDIELNENTLIRIHVITEEDGQIRIFLDSGSLSISSGAGSVYAPGMALNILGNTITLQPETVLSASAEETGMTVQVSEGSVTITEYGGQSSVLETGGFFVLDNGIEQPPPAVVVTHPRPNARFIKNSNGMLSIPFAWNAINLDPAQLLRLEIAHDSNFTRIVQTIDGFDFINVDADFGAGRWHWRLSSHGNYFSTGQFSIVDAVTTAISPVQNALFVYQGRRPVIRFEWSPVEGVSYYNFEASLFADFTNPMITRQTAATFLVEHDLPQGLWYWRVKPVFSPLFEGVPVFSAPASFRIEQAYQLAPEENLVALILPEAVSQQPVPEPDPEPEPAAIVVQAPPAAPVVAAPAVRPAPPPPRPQVTPAAVAPPPLLGEPVIRWPAAGYRINFQDLRITRRIDFAWQPVQGANAYILTLYHQQGGVRRQVFRTEPLQRTEWVLDNLSLLEQGTFVWNVEAVNINTLGVIQNRGRVSERTFVVDIPLTGSIQIGDIEVIHGQ